MKQAARLDHAKPSLIRAMYSQVPDNCVSLGLGEPGWPVHTSAASGIKELARCCSYGPNSGLPELQKALAEYSCTETENIMISSGSQAALFSLCQAWLERGDKILVPDPGFPAYRSLGLLCGATVLPYTLGQGSRLNVLTIEAILRKNASVKILIINHPANPGGGGLDLCELEKLVRLCSARDILLISDEVYRDLYLETPVPSLRDVSEQGLVLNSFSKAWGVPGIRIGWAHGCPGILKPAQLVHSYMTSTAAISSQLAALALLNAGKDVLCEARRHVRLRWDILCKAIETNLGFQPQRPDAGFYYCLPLPAQWESRSLEFCLQLRDEAGLILIPGAAFSSQEQSFARISFGGNPEELKEGIQRLGRFWETV